MHVVETDYALSLLRSAGYECVFRENEWVECLIWNTTERWTGRGTTHADAVDNAIRQMFPSAAARGLLLNAAADGAVLLEPPIVESVQPHAQSTSQPRSAVATAPNTYTRQFGRGSDADAALADVGLLDELIDAKRPELALMTPGRQRLAILSWICHARSMQECAEGAPRVMTAVTHVARKLTLLSKRWWPGSVLSLQLDATPYHVGRELELPRSEWPRDWVEAARCAELHLRRKIRDETVDGRDSFGWLATDIRVPAPESPDQILEDVRQQLEQVAGPLDHKPPSRAPEGIRRPIHEMRLRQHYWARHVRWIRGYVTDPLAWGALIGRLRWMASQASRRDEQLLGLLSAEYVPEGSWFVGEEEVAHTESNDRLRTQVLQRASILKNVDLDAMLMWLSDAVMVLETGAISRQLAPFQQQILEINPDELGDWEPARRDKFRAVQAQLVSERGGASPAYTADARRLSRIVFHRYSAATEGADAMSALREKVASHMAEYTAVYISEVDSELTPTVWCDRLGFSDVRRIDADSDALTKIREALAGSRQGPVIVLSDTGFHSHRFDLEVIRECRQHNVQHVRAPNVDLAAISIAQSVGLLRTTAAL